MITRDFCKIFRTELDKALISVGEKTGVNISAGSIRFDANQLSLTVKATEKPSDGKSAEQSNFEKYAEYFGLKKEDFGALFSMDGKDFVIVGIKETAQKNNCLIRDIKTEKTYVARPSEVKDCLEKQGGKI